ncbi:hypothetical protein I3760_11G105400 [Carya illinoinensis]|nr:hypothetical protein I3760_11G105400 [Carya illinoinensis]
MSLLALDETSWMKAHHRFTLKQMFSNSSRCQEEVLLKVLLFPVTWSCVLKVVWHGHHGYIIRRSFLSQDSSCNPRSITTSQPIRLNKLGWCFPLRLGWCQALLPQWNHSGLGICPLVKEEENMPRRSAPSRIDSTPAHC